MISLRDILNVSRVECINRRKCAHYYYIQTKTVSLIWLNLKFVKESVTKSSRPSLIRTLDLQPILFVEHINMITCAHYILLHSNCIWLSLLQIFNWIADVLLTYYGEYVLELRPVAYMYHKVPSFNISHLEAHAGFFRLLM